VSFSQESGLGGGSELKICPRCSVLIVKMDDGTHLFSCAPRVFQYSVRYCKSRLFLVRIRIHVLVNLGPDPDPTTGNYLKLKNLKFSRRFDQLSRENI
jgi:hypothetical protein